jgi:hypothetical protein
MGAGSRPERSRSFLILFRFIVPFEPFADGADIDDQISQCSDDSEHFRSINDRVICHCLIVAVLARVGKMTCMNMRDRILAAGYAKSKRTD